MLTQNLYDFRGILRSIGVLDILDILLVAIILYNIIKLIRETRAMQLLKGIIAILAIYAFSTIIELKTISFIIKMILQIGPFALLIVFQPELRRALEHMGRTNISSISLFAPVMEQDEITRWKNCIAVICDACGRLSKKKTGALIVLEKKTMLGDIVKTGTIVDAVASAELIGNIFFTNSPLHDGAMIIRSGRVYAAGCFLPLSENYSISNELGTRHRAALGASENSDALVVVVSEETGAITVAHNGKLIRAITVEQLAAKLRKEFILEQGDDSHGKKGFWRGKQNTAEKR